MQKAATFVYALVVGVGGAWAQVPAAEQHSAHHASAPAIGEFTAGEVRRVDKDAQKVTLRHGPIGNLGMPDMTMVFRVSDPRWLDALKQGDRIRFKADKVGGQYTVTEIAPEK